MMFEELQYDAERVGNIMHQLISGKMPILLTDGPRQIDIMVENSPYYSLIQWYYEEQMDCYIHESYRTVFIPYDNVKNCPAINKDKNPLVSTSSLRTCDKKVVKKAQVPTFELHELLFPFRDCLELYAQQSHFIMQPLSLLTTKVKNLSPI